MLLWFQLHGGPVPRPDEHLPALPWFVRLTDPDARSELTVLRCRWHFWRRRYCDQVHALPSSPALRVPCNPLTFSVLQSGSFSLPGSSSSSGCLQPSHPGASVHCLFHARSSERENKSAGWALEITNWSGASCTGTPTRNFIPDGVCVGFSESGTSASLQSTCTSDWSQTVYGSRV